MRGYPRPVDRDILELMVAYGLLPGATVGDGDEAARIPERAPSGPSAVLGVVGGSAHAGQTTVVVGLAQTWASQGRRVLLVDLDPAEELSRMLQVGVSVYAGTGHSILYALRDGQPIEPMGTVIPEVDIVVSGTINTWEPDALAAEIRRVPGGLARVLASVTAHYDRVLVDCPRAPGALVRAVADMADAMLPVVLSGPAVPAVPALADRFKVLGAVLTRWRPDASPAPEWLQAAAVRGSPWFDTVLPEIAGLRDAWDLVAGGPGGADNAFRRLAAEIDARLAGRPTLPETV